MKRKGLFDFEILKHYRKTYLLIVLLLCSLADLVAIRASMVYYQNGIYMKKPYDLVFSEKLEGPMNLEKAHYVIEEKKRLSDLTAGQTAPTKPDPSSISGNLYSDWALFEFDIHPDIEYAYGYKFYAQDIVERARENIKLYTETGNKKGVQENQLIVDSFSNRQIRNLTNLRGMNAYLQYDYSLIIMLLLGVLIITPVYITETENKMNFLFPGLRNAGVKLEKTKINFTLLTAFLLTTWFSLLDFVGFAIFAHLKGFAEPLYAVKLFRHSLLNVRIWQYLLIVYLVKLLAISTIFLFFLLVSKLSKNIIAGFLINIASVAVLLFTNTYPKETYSFLELINPSFLLKFRYGVLRFSTQTVFESVLPSYPLGIGAGVGLFVILIVFHGLAHKRTRA